MLGPHATAPRKRRSAALSRAAIALVGLGLVGSACGTPNPRILDSTEKARGMPSSELGNEKTEREKIEALIAAVRRSEHTFLHDDIERTGVATADKLQLLLERDPHGVQSAREFITRIAAPERTDEPADRVVVSEEQSILAQHWYKSRLAEIEGRPAPKADPEQIRQAEKHARRLEILDVLLIVETSDLRFVSPPRKLVTKPKKRPGKRGSFAGSRKPKRKEYTGEQFADMLRKKWEFLGADIEDIDTFIDEIASDSFASMVRYQVLLEDGSEKDFAAWLRGKLDQERTKIAQGGAP